MGSPLKMFPLQSGYVVWRSRGDTDVELAPFDIFVKGSKELDSFVNVWVDSRSIDGSTEPRLVRLM